jgi:AAA family ATP:ADP antiporter
VFNLFIVAVFWSLMADVFESEQAARLFGMIAGGLSTGGLIGPALAAQLVPVIGTINLLPASALLLGLSAFIMSRLIGLSAMGGEGERSAQENAQLMQGSAFDAFRQVLRSPYLAAISAFVLLLTSVSTVLYLEQQRIVAANIADRDAQTVLFARIDFWVQAASLLTQFFFFSRILKWFGFATAIGMVPALLIIAFALFAMSPSLAVIIAAMMARRIGEYGLTRPCRDMLFTVVARDEKYKAKNLIDTFVYRGGDAVSASVYAGVVALASTQGQAAAAGTMGVVLCVVWLALALWLAGRFKARAASGAAHTRPQEA